MESYLLKSSLALIILYGLYRIVLRYEFNHQLNRFIGLACVLFSISFPFVEFKDLPQGNNLSGTLYMMAKSTGDFQNTVSSVISKDTMSIFLLLYAIGASVFLFRCLVGLTTLVRLYFTSPKSYRWGFTVISLSRSLSPFTFFNVLFVGNNRIEDSEMETMLLHERVHRDQYHSIDAVLLEALTVIFCPVTKDPFGTAANQLRIDMDFTCGGLELLQSNLNESHKRNGGNSGGQGLIDLCNLCHFGCNFEHERRKTVRGGASFCTVCNCGLDLRPVTVAVKKLVRRIDLILQIVVSLE